MLLSTASTIFTNFSNSLWTSSFPINFSTCHTSSLLYCPTLSTPSLTLLKLSCGLTLSLHLTLYAYHHSVQHPPYHGDLSTLSVPQLSHQFPLTPDVPRCLTPHHPTLPPSTTPLPVTLFLHPSDPLSHSTFPHFHRVHSLLFSRYHAVP